MFELPEPDSNLSGWPWDSPAGHLELKADELERLPQISIVTPSYNQGQFIEKCIRSILQQNYPKLEFIIMDGGSSDESLEIIRKYEPWITIWESKGDRGQSHALNKGFENANGDLLGWLNCDDFLTPNALFRVAHHYLNMDQDKFGAIVGDGDIIDEKGNSYFSPPLPEISFETLVQWNNGTNFMQPSCFFTQSAWQDCGPLDEDLQYCMDFDLWLKISKKYEFSTVPETLSHSLTHADAKTRAQAERSLVEVAVVICRHGEEGIALRNLFVLADELANFKHEHETLMQDESLPG